MSKFKAMKRNLFIFLIIILYCTAVYFAIEWKDPSETVFKAHTSEVTFIPEGKRKPLKIFIVPKGFDQDIKTLNKEILKHQREMNLLEISMKETEKQQNLIDKEITKIERLLDSIENQQ